MSTRDRAQRWTMEALVESCELSETYTDDALALLVEHDAKHRAEALREAADAIVAEYDRQLWATKPGKHWAADMVRSMADAAGQSGPAPEPPTIENYPGELAMLRGVLGVVRTIAQHGDINELRRVIAEHYADERDAYAEQGEKDTAPAATSTRFAIDHRRATTERHELLRLAIRDQGGEWTTRRVRLLYRGLGIRDLFRSTLRHDLAELCRAGHLTLHDEDKGRRYYTPTTNGGDAR